MRLALIIVNYRTPAFVCDCLQSLSAQVNTDLDRVILVDNDSGDGSVSKLLTEISAQGWDTWVSVLSLNYNGGFSAGNNAALRKLLTANGIQPDYLMLLNPDTIVLPGSIKYLVQFLDEHPKVGIVGSQLVNENHQLESSARNYPSPLSELDAGARTGVLARGLRRWQVAMPVVEYAHPCDWVSGAAMMIRREVLEQIGLMDEEYFLYFEELDFCQRASLAGWQIWLEPRSLIVHLEGQSTGKQIRRKRRGKYWYDSRRRYFVKHQGLVRWLLADLFWSVGRLGLLIRKMMKLGGDTSCDPLYFTQDLLLGDLRALANGAVFRIKRYKGKL